MYRKLRQQWLLIPVLIVLMFSGSFLFTRNHEQADVYYARTTLKTTEAAFSVHPLRHVTKSMSELGRMDEINRYVLFLNQIPNCGAEVVIFLMQKLQGFNNYRHVRLKGGGTMNRMKQEQFVDKVYETIRTQAVPLSFDSQIRFINFTTFDKQSPTFISMIREPADKVMSRSFYHKHGNKDELILCLTQGKSNCSRVKVSTDHLTIPFFCGHEEECLRNEAWALEAAKRTVEKYYPVVGVLEEFNATLDVLEHHIPYYFKGVHDVYRNKIIERFNSKKSPQPPDKTRKLLRTILAHEYEFYEWTKRRLFNQLQMFTGHK